MEHSSLRADVGIVIPTKGRPDDLLACLQAIDRAAVFAETRVDVAVVDDGCPRYEARAVVEQFMKNSRACRVLYAVNPGPAGAAGARNHACGMLDAEIIGLVDDDAVVSENWIDFAIKSCRPGVALTGRIESLGAMDVFTRARQARYDQRRLTSLRRESVSFLAGGNAAVSRADIERVGAFDTTFTMMHDRDLALRLVSCGVRILYADEMTIHHRHFKDMLTYVTMTARSGRYRRLLEQRWPEVTGWSLKDPWNSAKGTHEDWSIRTVVALSELLHGVGYLYERYLSRRNPWTANQLLEPS